MSEYEFRVLCKDDEACKRVRFSQEWGIPDKEVLKNEDRRNILGTPFYEKIVKGTPFDKDCSHTDIPMHYHYELASNDFKYSIETNCNDCGSLLTLVPFEYGDFFKNGKKDKKLVLAVDFENYEKWNSKFRKQVKKSNSVLVR